MDHPPPYTYHTIKWGAPITSIGKYYSMQRVPSFSPFHPLLTLKLPTHPNLLYTPVFMAPSLVSTHFDLCCLTFPHKPDEVASVWRLQKLVCNKLLDLLCLSIQELLKHNLWLL